MHAKRFLLRVMQTNCRVNLEVPNLGYYTQRLKSLLTNCNFDYNYHLQF